MNKKLEKSIYEMLKAISEILKDNLQSFYIYGSCVLDDFKLGWSDIDILVLTKNKINLKTANELLTLRQKLLEEYPGNKYFRKFEGAILSRSSFVKQTKDNVVYWGTRGEKIKENYKLDSFSMKELLENGLLLFGHDIRNQLNKPTFNQLYEDILYHYETIRDYGQKADRNLYTFGWFLDISRCLYTLQTEKIISKTKAGEWALKNNLCPDKKALKVCLKVRKHPSKCKKNKKIMDYAETLGPSIKDYADVLKISLENTKRS